MSLFHSTYHYPVLDLLSKSLYLYTIYLCKFNMVMRCPMQKNPDCEDISGMPSIPPPKNYRQLYRRNRDKIQESTPPTPDATKKKKQHQGLWTPPPDLLPQPILPAVDSKFNFHIDNNITIFIKTIL